VTGQRLGFSLAAAENLDFFRQRVDGSIMSVELSKVVEEPEFATLQLWRYGEG
jgi:hypothetical protein